MATTYSANMGGVLAPGATVATELLSRVGGFIAGCGFAALAVVDHAVNGQGTSPAEISNIIQTAINEGQAGPGGVATPSNIETVSARNLGVPLASVPWQTALNTYAGVKPVELGVSNASAFGGADSNVQGHYIAVLGRTANGGFVVSDPNTPQSVAGQAVVYSASQIAAARPFWAGVPIPNLSGPQGSPSLFPLITAAPTAAANVATSASSGVASAIQGAVSTITTDVATGARLAGWLVLALVIMGAGLWFIIPDETKQQAAGAVKGAAKAATGAATDAAVAA